MINVRFTLVHDPALSIMYNPVAQQEVALAMTDDPATTEPTEDPIEEAPVTEPADTGEEETEEEEPKQDMQTG